MEVSFSIKRDDYYLPCVQCGRTISELGSYWLRQYGYDRVHYNAFTCFVRVCENCYKRSLLGESRKLFYCQGCGSLKPFDSAVGHFLHHGTVYVCEECHDRCVDDYFTEPDSGCRFFPVRYDCVCSVCGRAFMKCDTNYKYRAYDDSEPDEPCICEVCSGLLSLGEDRFIDFLGIDMDTLQSLQCLYELRDAGKIAGDE